MVHPFCPYPRFEFVRPSLFTPLPPCFLLSYGNLSWFSPLFVLSPPSLDPYLLFCFFLLPPPHFSPKKWVPLSLFQIPSRFLSSCLSGGLGLRSHLARYSYFFPETPCAVCLPVTACLPGDFFLVSSFRRLIESSLSFPTYPLPHLCASATL